MNTPMTLNHIFRPMPRLTQVKQELRDAVTKALDDVAFSDLSDGRPYKQIMEDVERTLLKTILDKHEGVITYAAREIGCNRSTLRNLAKKHQLR